MKSPLKKLVGFFLQGLLVLVPIGVTVYVVYRVFSFVDGLVYHWLDIDIPGLGLPLVLIGITALGYFFSLLGERILRLLDNAIGRMPLVKIIYSSIKDFMEAFVGEKKKFTEPVLVTLNPNGLECIGFLTRKDLSALGLEGKVAVYLPYSYTFTGQMVVVPTDKVKPLLVNSGDMMKFLVSGGVTGL